MEHTSNNNYILYGIGINFFSYVARLKEREEEFLITDSNPQKWGKKYLWNVSECVPPDVALSKDNPIVVITVEKKRNIEEIVELCENKGIPYVHARELIGSYRMGTPFEWIRNNSKEMIKRFIDISLGDANVCNLRCHYCYIRRKKGFIKSKSQGILSAEEIGMSLSENNLGGKAFVNLCASGETLLVENIIEIVNELLQEGHIVGIVTNGTVTKRIEEITSFPEELQQRVFIKLSFHYDELCKKGLMDRFWDNVGIIRGSKCSYTIEITPSDIIINNINEIKAMFNEKAYGAMPHISFTRDSKKQGLDIFSELQLDEFIDTWGQFDSKMFNLKCQLYNRKIKEYCHAGEWSFLVETSMAGARTCYGYVTENQLLDKDYFKKLQVAKNNCRKPYCFNGHALIAWGVVPGVGDEYTYFDMRDRQDNTGHHWVRYDVEKAFRQKLYDNRFIYRERWKDYDSLINRGNRRGIILFNSPDYRNIGDHAIAKGERIFFEENYPEYELFEVSPSEYVREYNVIHQQIREDDILFISGGGNIGDLYLYLFDITLDIIDSFPDNEIVILPQSIYFTDSDLGEKEKEHLRETVLSHNNITICVREEYSLERIKAIFKDDMNCICVPDMAMGLTRRFYKDRKGALVCLRDDLEKIFDDESVITRTLEQMGYDWNKISMISVDNVLLDNRDKTINEVFEMLGSVEVVVTDRLHCMVFCWLTNTPCVFFDSLTKKNVGVYRWIDDCRYIKCCNKIGELSQSIREVANSSDKALAESSRVKDGFRKLLKELHNRGIK